MASKEGKMPGGRGYETYVELLCSCPVSSRRSGNTCAEGSYKVGLSIDGRLKNLADGDSNVLAVELVEYLSISGNAESGRGFLLMEEAVETMDEARALTVSVEGRS